LETRELRPQGNKLTEMQQLDERVSSVLEQPVINNLKQPVSHKVFNKSTTLHLKIVLQITEFTNL